MADRFPLIVDADNTNIKELPSGDNLDLTGSDIVNVVDVTTSGNMVVGGNLTVNGTTTTINSDTLTIDDKNIVLASGAADAAAANGAGITIDGASANLLYSSSTDGFSFNKGVTVPSLTTTGNVSFGDNDKAIFGAGSDLQIYHNGSNSYVQDAGTGKLHITSNGTGVSIDKGTSELMATFDIDGAVTLYHDNSQVFSTTSSGIDVTGTMTGTVDNTATPAQIATDSNAVLLLENTNASGSAGIRLRGGNGAGVLMYGENNTTDKFHLLPRNDTSKAFTLDHVGAAEFAGTVTANAGVVVDNITIDGNEIDVNSGDLTLDVAGDIELDAGGGDFIFKDDGTSIFLVNHSSSDVQLTSMVNNKDIIFRGNDGGSFITALTLDMSESGAATFNAGVTATGLTINGTSNFNSTATFADGSELRFGADNDMALFHSSGVNHIRVNSGIFKLRADDMRFTAQNGTSEFARFDASGNLLVSKTSTSYAVEGIALRADNAGVQSTVTDEAPFTANRLNSDGRLILFAKDTTTVGSIGVANGDLNINGDTGIRFQDTSIMPRRAGSDVDATVDIGLSSHRWKDLYLSGGTYITGSVPRLQFNDSDGTNTQGEIRQLSDAIIIKSRNGTSNGVVKFSGDNGTTETEYARFDASGNLLVGTTNTLPAINNVEGIALSAGSFGGRLEVSRDGAEAVSINRKTNDGSLMSFKKDGTTVGSIGTSYGRLTIGDASVGVRFGDDLDTIVPWNVSTNAARDAGIDLGNGSVRFKDLYLSGSATTGGNFLAESSSTINSTIRATGNNTRAIGNYQAHDSSGNDVNMVLGVFGDSNRGEVSTNTNHTLRFYVNNTPSKYLEIATTGQVFTSHGMVVNEDSNDSDFRVESNNKSHMFFVDASNDGVGIGDGYTQPLGLMIASTTSTTNAIDTKLNLRAYSSGTTTTGFGPGITFGGARNGDGVIQSMARINAVAEVNSGTTLSSGLSFETATAGVESEKMRIQNDGKIRLGNTSDHVMVDVTASNAALQLIDNNQSNPPTIRGNGPNFTIENGGLEMMRVSGTSDIVFNEASQDINFRIEGNNLASAFFVDAGEDQVGIGTTSVTASFMFGVQGSTALGDRANNVAGGGYRTEISGLSISDGSGVYGSYGQLNFYANNSFTSSARRWVITNGLSANKLGFIVGDSAHNSQPEVDGTNGTVTNGIVALSFDNVGSAVFNEDSQDADFRVESSGNSHMLFVDGGNDRVGIGTTSPSAVLETVSETNGGAPVFRAGTADFLGVVIGTGGGGFAIESNNYFSVWHQPYADRGTQTNLTERMRIDSSGNLLVGGTSIGDDNSFAVASSGNITIARASGSPRTHASFVNGSSTVGTITTSTTATAYNTSSDQRLKDNIVDAPSASDDIDAIQVRSFDWKADGSHQKYGMVAQELNTVAPEAVSEGATEEDMMGVDYSKLVPMMLKEIQSLRARVAQLESS